MKRKYFYRVFVSEIYDDKNVQAILEETSFDFEELNKAKNFAITCMKHNKYCIVNVQALEIQKYKKQRN